MVMAGIEVGDRIAYIKHGLPNRDMLRAFWTSVYRPPGAGVQAAAPWKIRGLSGF
jgi:hypothetical protein